MALLMQRNPITPRRTLDQSRTKQSMYCDTSLTFAAYSMSIPLAFVLGNQTPPPKWDGICMKLNNRSWLIRNCKQQPNLYCRNQRTTIYQRCPKRTTNFIVVAMGVANLHFPHVRMAGLTGAGHMKARPSQQRAEPPVARLAPSPAPAIRTGCLYPSDSPSLHWWRLVALILSEPVECFPLIPLIPKLMACCWCICGLSSWRLRLKNWGGIYTSDLKIALGGNTMLVSLARDINQRPYYYKVQASVGCTVQNYLLYLFSEEVQNYLSIIY
jgi:hypothetical protein